MHAKVNKLVLLLLLAVQSVVAADKLPDPDFRTWQFGVGAGKPDTIRDLPDTMRLNYSLHQAVNDYSVANSFNGNLVSPIQSKLYFDRSDKSENIFINDYAPYIITPHQVRFFKTNLPFSTIAYKKGFKTYRDENDLNLLLTGNIRPDLNIGAELTYLNAIGHYANQEGKTFNGNAFLSYSGENYAIHGAFTWSNLSNFESGGLVNTNELNGALQPEDITTKLKAMSAMNYLAAYVNHSYTLRSQDSIPLMTFRHVFDLNSSTKRYVEQTAKQSFYTNNYIDQSATRDSANFLTINNTLAATFHEEFNNLLRFGFDVYARNEAQRYMFIPDTLTSVGALDSTRSLSQKWVNNTFLGGALYMHDNPYFRYSVDGEVCLIGYKLGEFQINGKVSGSIPISRRDTSALHDTRNMLNLSANVSFRSETPSYYLQHYRSNHFVWTNTFAKPLILDVGGSLAFTNNGGWTDWIKPQLDINFRNITRPIYWSSTGNPQQKNGNQQIFAANLHLDITTPWINLENNVVYQHASDSIMPLPTLTLFHNLYYHGVWFRAMEAQIGVNMRYFTRYYAPLLNPATGQFCIQQSVQIGNYPILNVYANFYVRLIRLRFFVEYNHFNQTFMPNAGYLSMPGYPYNPAVFRAGLAWHFFK